MATLKIDEEKYVCNILSCKYRSQQSLDELAVEAKIKLEKM